MDRLLVFAIVLLTIAFAAAVGNTTGTTLKPSSTTANNNHSCAQYDGDCDKCVKSLKAKCIYCNDAKKCRDFLGKGIFSIGDVCKGGLMSGSWGTCSVNMMALIIGMSVVGGVLLISLCTCICCCCCCKDSAKQKLKWLRQDAASQRKTEERKAKYAERRAERQAKNDEIRKKYGLFKGDQGGYQRMDNDA